MKHFNKQYIFHYTASINWRGHHGSTVITIQIQEDSGVKLTLPRSARLHTAPSTQDAVLQSMQNHALMHWLLCTYLCTQYANRNKSRTEDHVHWKRFCFYILERCFLHIALKFIQTQQGVEVMPTAWKRAASPQLLHFFIIIFLLFY